MRLEDIFEADFSVRKTVWSKRGEQVIRREVDACAPSDIAVKKKLKSHEREEDAAAT